MTDLHSTLLTAIQQRMEVAKAATPGPWRVDGETYAEAIYAPDDTAVVAGGRWNDEGPVFETTADALHIAANDPATILRHCERDLAVVRRHAPVVTANGQTFCEHCSNEGYELVPLDRCAERRDLAHAYGVEVSDG